jgi:PAS domain S-box-containing protein
VCAIEQVTLQLKWRHQFQFAGYYAAQQQGYYRDAGLNVTINPASPGKDPVRAVIDGAAQYGVGTSSLLLVRNAGKPVVVLAVIFQHSPYILLTKQFSASQTIHNLMGKRLMLEPQADELIAYLKSEGIPLESMQVSDHTFKITDLIVGNVDVMSGYVTDDPHELERAGFAYHAYTPRSAGIDFYGDNLFTTEDELKKHPERVKAFREASLKGWQYALQHPDKIIDLIISSYTPHADRSHLKYEAEQIRQLVQPDLVDIGYMHPGRWQHIVDIYSGLGMLPKNFDVNPFLFDPYPHKDLRAFYRIAGVFLGLALLIMAVRLIITSRTLKWSEEQVRRQLNEITLINANLEQRVAERTEELHEERQRLEGIISGTNVGTWEWDVQSGALIVNERWGEIIGYSLAELSPVSIKTWLKCAHSGDLKTCKELLERHFSGELAHYEFESRMKHKNGNWVWVLDRGKVALWSEDGKPLLMLGTHQDITGRKQMEEIRDEAQTRLQKISSRVPGVLYQFLLRRDGSTCFPFASDAIREIYRVTPEEVREDATKAYSAIHPDDYDDVVAAISQSAADLSMWSHEYRVKFADGTERWLFGNALPERETDGAVLWHGFISDITERKQAEEELQVAKIDAEAANLAKSRFLAIVAHEFRTPLALLTMSVDILDRYWERLSTEERQEQHLQIRTAKKQMARLIDSVLVFSRQEKPTFPEIPVQIDAAEICRTVAEEIISVWGGEHSFTMDIDPECGRPLLIEILFQRVIANLLTNALRFTPPGGVIAFSVALQEHRLVIEVADTGIGIPEDEQQKVFEAFYRSSNVDARSGLGLGLSIVSEAVHLMNGTITVTSTVGVGSTFRVELPVE